LNPDELTVPFFHSEVRIGTNEAKMRKRSLQPHENDVEKKLRDDGKNCYEITSKIT